MTTPLRIGLLGASAIAPWVIVGPARQRSEVQLQAVAARDPARAAAFAAEHGVAHVAADYAALVARDDVDLVYVALPPSEHLRWCIAALQAGKAVLCEKPMAMSPREVTAMFDAAQAAGRPLWEAMHYRHHPAVRAFMAAVAGGEIGELQTVDASFVGHLPYTPTEIRWQPALGGGATMDLGCYALHAVQSLLGDPLSVRSAQAQVDRGIDAACTAELTGSDGVTARMACSFLAPEHRSQLVATGSRGTLRFDNFTSPTWEGACVLERNGQTHALPIDARSTYDHQLDFVYRHWRAAPDPAAREDSERNRTLIDEVLRAAGLR